MPLHRIIEHYGEVLFREIELLLIQLGVKYHYNKGSKFILENGSEIFGATAQNPTSILGFTDIECAIIDEAAYCPEELYNYITDRMRGEHVKQGKVRLISSPSSLVQFKWFRDICKKYCDKVIRATTLDNPFTSDEYKQAQIEKYGKGTPMYRQQILGEFIDENLANAIISISDYPLTKKENFGVRKMGIDCSGSGGDYNVFVVSDDNGILEIVREQIADTYKLYNIAKDLITKWNIRKTNIDCTGGFGNGVADMLEHNNFSVGRINFGQKALKDTYVNARAEMYFQLVDKIKSGFYVDDETIREELSYTTYLINGSGRTLLTPKNDIKELIGRSPDTSDALALSIYEDEEFISPAQSLNIAMRFTTV